MRKPSITGGVLLLLSLLLCQCNSDIFVGEQLKASATELELDGNGDTQTISFNHSDWDITGVYNDPVSSDIALNWKSFDQEGKPIEESYSEARLKGLGKIVFYDWEGLEQFCLERRKGKELMIVVEENTGLHPRDIQVNLDNDDDFYNPEVINLKIPPCERYEAVGFTFPDTPSSYTTRAYSLNYTAHIDNSHADTPLTTTLYPFAGASRLYIFPSDSWSIPSGLLKDERLTIELPTCQDGKLIPSGTTADFTNGGMIELPLEDVEEKTVEVTIPARTRQDVEVWVKLESFDTSYTLTIRNPKSGKVRTYTGEMHSSTPYDYYLQYKAPEE